MEPTVVSSLAVPMSFTPPMHPPRLLLGSPHQLHDGPQRLIKWHQLPATPAVQNVAQCFKLFQYVYVLFFDPRSSTQSTSQHFPIL